jgi:hypothetical protein
MINLPELMKTTPQRQSRKDNSAPRRSLGARGTLVVFFSLVLLILPAQAADFNRHSKFDSVAAFAASTKAFRPAGANSELSPLFSIREMGEENHGKAVVAQTMQSCNLLWSNADSALLFAVASPATEATRSSVGVLFLLRRSGIQWEIADLLRFTAMGKEAECSAELTSGAGTGYQLGSEGMPPVVTIKAANGGRGYGYQASASYNFTASKLQRIELK